MASDSTDPNWSSASPTMNSWPMRCRSVMSSKTWSTHDWLGVGDGDSVGLWLGRLEVGGDVGGGLAAEPPDPHAEARNANATTDTTPRLMSLILQWNNESDAYGV